MDTPHPTTTDTNIAPTLRFHPVAEYFRTQFARALRWGVTPSAERITCIAGHACTNVLRLEAALAQQTLITAADILTVDDVLESPLVTQRVILDIVQTIPLLHTEVAWVYTAWEHLRQARNGKGRDVIVHGLIEPIVALIEGQRLSGECAVWLSRFIQPAHQAEIAACARAPVVATVSPVPVTTPPADWRPVWQAIAAGHLHDAKCLKEQRGWSERHMRRIRRAVTRLGPLIDLPLTQRQLLALSTWPTAMLEQLRTEGQLTLDGTRITTARLQEWSAEALTHMPARLTQRVTPPTPKGEAA
jgi:hypothetical protein